MKILRSLPTKLIKEKYHLGDSFEEETHYEIEVRNGSLVTTHFVQSEYNQRIYKKFGVFHENGRIVDDDDFILKKYDYEYCCPFSTSGEIFGGHRLAGGDWQMSMADGSMKLLSKLTLIKPMIPNLDKWDEEEFDAELIQNFKSLLKNTPAYELPKAFLSHLKNKYKLIKKD